MHISLVLKLANVIDTAIAAVSLLSLYWAYVALPVLRIFRAESKINRQHWNIQRSDDPY